MDDPLVTLWRPVCDRERDLMAAADMRGYPPRLLPEQPFLYVVLSEAYATKIARDWVGPYDRSYVTRCQVRAEFLANYTIKKAGEQDEYWIPAADLAAFNAAIVGQIEIVAKFP
jgi:hypothetical protein